MKELQSPIRGRDNHNDTLNIQGGTTSEYYHLTSGEYTSLVTSGDLANKMDIDGTNSNISYLDFNISSGLVVSHEEGRVHWSSDDGTLCVDLPGGEVMLQVGQETLIKVKNDSGGTIPNGGVVYVSGSTGDRPKVDLAISSDQTKTFVLGIATEEILDNHFGYVCMHGLVRDVNTDGLTPGLPIWLHNVAGQYTQTRPEAPLINVFLGYVIRAHATEGLIAVRPVVIPRLSALSDVNGTPLTTNGQILVWDNDRTVFDGNYNINDYLKTSGDQTVTSGVITFVDFPEISSGIPTTDNQFATKKYVDDEDAVIPLITKEPTGFETRTTSTLSFDSDPLSDTFLQFTITPTITSFNIWSKGVKFEKTASNVSITNTLGLWYIYFNTSGVLSAMQTVWDFVDGNIPVATLYWDGVVGLICDERHGIIMDGMTHAYLHYSVGVRYYSGINLTINDTTFSTDIGYILDEDIRFTVSAQTTCRVFYRESGFYKFTAPQAKWYIEGGAGTTLLQYDNAGALATVDNNKYMAMWFFAVNDISNPIWVLTGQRQDTLLADARANNNYQSLVLLTLPSAEMKLLYRIIVQRSGTSEVWIETADYRSVSNLPASNYVATNHSSLTGLTNDDHVQYLLANATRPLTADWDVGAYKITANQLASDVSSGTAPLVITSPTNVSNLNADYVDGYHASDFSLSGHNHDHNTLTNTHNLTTDIDHDSLTNTHNLTTDIDHNALTNYDANKHFTQAEITTVGTVTSGNVDAIALQLKIANNLSDVANRQTALNNLTQVSSGTNEHVLTKDTGTGNAIWKVAGGGLSEVKPSNIVATNSPSSGQMPLYTSENEFTWSTPGSDATKLDKSGTEISTSSGIITFNGYPKISTSYYLDFGDPENQYEFTPKTYVDTQITNSLLPTMVTANTGTSYTVNLSSGSCFDLTLTGDCTFTFPSSGSTNKMSQFWIYLKRDATPNRTVTWDTDVKWSMDIVPALDGTASKLTIFRFSQLGNTSRWYGEVLATGVTP